jgi:hypothetical protein
MGGLLRGVSDVYKSDSYSGAVAVGSSWYESSARVARGLQHVTVLVCCQKRAHLDVQVQLHPRLMPSAGVTWGGCVLELSGFEELRRRLAVPAAVSAQRSETLWAHCAPAALSAECDTRVLLLPTGRAIGR